MTDTHSSYREYQIETVTDDGRMEVAMRRLEPQCSYQMVRIDSRSLYARDRGYAVPDARHDVVMEHIHGIRVNPTMRGHQGQNVRSQDAKQEQPPFE
jgi:hypothetical protein